MKMNIDEIMKNYIRLRGDKKDTAAMAREIQDQINDLEVSILKNFEETGKSKVSMNGETVYLKTELYAGFAKDSDGNPVTPEKAMQALRDAGLEEFCPEKINTASLTAFFKELKEDKKGLPEGLQGVFVINEVFKISSRKS